MQKNPNYPKEIIVGKVIGARGIKGQLKIRSESDNPNRFTTNTEIFIDNKKYTINKVDNDEKKQLIYINITNINDRNSAEKVIGKLIKVPISSLPNFINAPVYSVLSFKIKVSPKQTDISSSDISFLTK